jgi:hypothetical protein
MGQCTAEPFRPLYVESAPGCGGSVTLYTNTEQMQHHISKTKPKKILLYGENWVIVTRF